MKKIFLSVALVVSWVWIAKAQSSFVPKNMGLAINSTYDEIHPLISHDGKTLYFTRKNHPQNVGGAKNTSSIWMSVREANGNWSPALPAAELNTGKHNQALSITSDGKQILIYNDEGLSLWDRDAKTISNLKLKATQDAAMTSDGKYIIFGRSGKLYLSERAQDLTWTAPKQIKDFNVGKFISPTLLEDGTLYFSVPKKGKGQDLCKTRRIDGSWEQWEPLQFLNDTINTTAVETGLHTTPNGAWGYYASVTPTGKSDIFVVKLYEDHPYVLLSGKVVNNVSKRPVRKKDVRIVVDGMVFKDAAINADSGTYAIKLPFGKRYAVLASIDHYQPVSFTVDATPYKEFTSMALDLEETPEPNVLLKGKTLIKNMDKPIPLQAKPKIVVDGVEIDSASIDVSGNYELKLKHGTYYYVQVVAKRFESFPAMVDLKDIDGYEVIEMDLHADAEKMAIVSGMLRDRKTGQPLPSTLSLRVEVEGVESLSAAIDSLNGNYEIRLPLKEKHVVRVKAPGYYPVSEVVDVTNETSEVTISRDLTVVPIEKGQSVRLNTINVGVKLDVKQSYPELDSLAAFLNDHPRIRIEVGAHVERGVKTSTLKAAQDVANYIASKSVSRHRISSRGYGSTKPALITKTPEAKLQNRRIEFTFIDL